MFQPRRVLFLLLCTLASLSGLLAQVRADDGASVPMFRSNPEHTGEMPGPGPVGKPEILWQFETAGGIDASPAVVDGVVYITSGPGDGNLYAVDAATGAERWRFQINFRDHHLLATSSPAVADDVVYVGSNDGFLYALDVDSGAALWRWQVDGVWGGSVIEGSPVVADGLVYFNATDVLLTMKLYAIDVDSRGLSWDRDLGLTFMSAPTVADGLVFGAERDMAWAVDAITGQERWSSEDAYSGPTTPAVSGDLVYFAADDGGIVALDAATGRLAWRYDSGAGALSSPAVADGFVYVNTEQHLIALDAVTGAARWEQALDGATSGRTNVFISSPGVADGVVYVGTDAGIVYALDAVNGEDRWQLDLGSPITSSPAVIDGVVYVGDTSGVLSAIGNP